MITARQDNGKTVVETAGESTELLYELISVMDSVWGRFAARGEGAKIQQIILAYGKDPMGFRRMCHDD